MMRHSLLGMCFTQEVPMWRTKDEEHAADAISPACIACLAWRTVRSATAYVHDCRWHARHENADLLHSGCVHSDISEVFKQVL